jgi:hypothetical protein
MAFNVGGSFPASIVPMPQRVAVQDNYIDFNNITGGQWSQQYLPELYEQEVERYGNRTLSGFLRMVGAEMPMTSDQVIWSEQNRLHVAYNTVQVTAPAAYPALTIAITPQGGETTCGVRVGNTILVSDNATGLITTKLLVVGGTGALAGGVWTFTCQAYDAALPAGIVTGATSCSLFVYGSEFPKGSNGMSGAIEPSVTTFTNSPVIMKDNYELSGSDAAQIGWIEVATEDGTSGYLWYLKAESETRLRFEDYMEMSMVESELMGTAATAFGGNFGPGGAAQNIKGSQGLFAAIEARGNVYSGFAGAAAPGSGALGDFDEILKNLDKQGAIEENMLFLSRSTALDFDDMIAAMNGAYASTQAASYGLFDNEAEMALNFGFSGFRRGSYDFYKTDWKYLNDATTRGLDKEIDGVLVPAGTSTVYDQMLGSNIRRPFLHVRYRASETEDRRFKSWITGSVGGAYTTDLDVMKVNFLSERCLVTQAANNFVLFKGA